MAMIEVVAHGGPRDGATYAVPQRLKNGALPARMVFHADPPPPGPPDETGRPTVIYHDYRLVRPQEGEPYFQYDGEILLTDEAAASYSDEGCPDDH